MENYIVPRERLISLLVAAEKLEALEAKGVESWCFYQKALNEYLLDAKKQYGLNNDTIFYDVASAKLRSGDFRKEV
jgi:hypothetical protein